MSNQQPGSHRELQHRLVVSSLIFSFTNESPQIALFKRSDKVSTYQYVLVPFMTVQYGHSLEDQLTGRGITSPPSREV